MSGETNPRNEMLQLNETLIFSRGETHSLSLSPTLTHSLPLSLSLSLLSLCCIFCKLLSNIWSILVFIFSPKDRLPIIFCFCSSSVAMFWMCRQYCVLDLIDRCSLPRECHHCTFRERKGEREKEQSHSRVALRNKHTHTHRISITKSIFLYSRLK